MKILQCPDCKGSALIKRVIEEQTTETIYYWNSGRWDEDSSNGTNYDEHTEFECEDCAKEIEEDDIIEKGEE